MTNDPEKIKPKVDFLIADDQEPILRSIREMLRAVFGPKKNIVIAQDGASAIKVCTTSEVQFVITDWNMPNITGLDLLQYLRQDLRYLDVPVLIISDEVSESKFHHAMAMGADAYQVKPFTQKLLLQVITTILAARQKQTPMQKMARKLHRLTLVRKYKEAIDLARRTLDCQYSPEIDLILATCHLQLKDLSTARSILEVMLERNTENSKASHLLGRVLVAMGQEEEALVHLNKASTAMPFDVECKVDTGEAHLKMGQEGKAAEIFETILGEGATDSAVTGIGNAYLNQGNLEKAGEFMDKAKEALPQTTPVFNKYAIALRKSGDVKKCIKQYKKCLRACPDHPVYMFNLARAHVAAGENKQAKKLLDKILEAQPNFTEAQELMKRVEP